MKRTGEIGSGSKSSRKKWSVLTVALCLLVIGVLDYPFLSRLYNQQVQGIVVKDYERTMDQANEANQKEEIKKARVYNQSLEQNGVILGDPFSQGAEADADYRALLNLQGNGVMGVIEIPRLRLALPIYHGTSEESLQKGAGHLEGSSLPVGGENTHTCISAHRGLPGKTMFTNLDQMEPGDCFLLKVMGETLCYRIYDIETVEPTDTEALQIREEKDLATLITCTPYGINTHRLYLHGERIPYEEMEDELEGKAFWEQILRQFWWVAVTALLLLWMGWLLIRINRIQTKINGK